MYAAHSQFLMPFTFQCSVFVWIVACQVPLSTGFSRQEYWSGLPFPPLGDLPDPVIKSACLVLAGGFSTIEPPGQPHRNHLVKINYSIIY